MKLNPGLLALAVGAFGIGVTEFAPMGLLPVIADDLGVSIPVAGLLISAYAIGVMLGAPLMTLTTGRVPRRTLLIALAAIFTLGNAVAALSDSYGMLLAARIVTSLNHGAFFGVGSIVAASLVPPRQQAGAVAAMFMGLTIANVVGVPLATWAGDVLGWRAVFWGIAALGGATMAALRLTLPTLPAPARGNAMAELRVLGRAPVLGALALTVVGSSAMHGSFVPDCAMASAPESNWEPGRAWAFRTRERQHGSSTLKLSKVLIPTRRSERRSAKQSGRRECSANSLMCLTITNA